MKFYIWNNTKKLNDDKNQLAFSYMMSVKLIRIKYFSKYFIYTIKSTEGKHRVDFLEFDFLT